MTDPTQIKKCRGCPKFLYRRRPETERKWNLREFHSQGCGSRFKPKKLSKRVPLRNVVP